MSISFDPTKNLCASGNGGAIITNDDELYRFADAYRKNGKPEFDSVGTNSQISEQDAAHILVRAKYIDAWQTRRSTIADYWNEAFVDLPVTLFNKTEYKEPHAHQKYVIYTQDRDNLYQHLTEYGIEPKVSYDRTIAEMLAYQSYENPSMFSISTMLSKGVISLPMYPELTDNEVEYIKEKVLNFYS
jgi:dTDP-4-amino-4,6-dideoxygalactose transaminase